MWERHRWAEHSADQETWSVCLTDDAYIAFLAKIYAIRGNANSQLQVYTQAIKDFKEAATLFNQAKMFKEERDMRDDIQNLEHLQTGSCW